MLADLLKEHGIVRTRQLPPVSLAAIICGCFFGSVTSAGLRQTGLDKMSLVIAGDLSSHHLWSGRHKLLDDSSQFLAPCRWSDGPAIGRDLPSSRADTGQRLEATLKSPHGLFAIVTLLVGFWGLVRPILMLLGAAW